MKEFKKLDWEAVRGVCVKLSLYDNGSNEDYRDLADFVQSIKKDSIDLVDLRVIAENIINHSYYSIEKIKREYGYNNDEEVLLLIVNELNYSTRVWIA